MKLVVTDKEIGSCIQLELASFSMNFQFFMFLFTIGRTFVIFQVRGFQEYYLSYDIHICSLELNKLSHVDSPALTSYINSYHSTKYHVLQKL